MNPFAILFTIGREPTRSSRMILAILSFVIPAAIWCLVSYVPAIWHPDIKIEEAGDSFFTAEQYVPSALFNEQVAALTAEGKDLPTGVPSNPAYLPKPHEVLLAFHKLFVTPPDRKGEPWFHQSMFNSIKIIFFGYMAALILGLPIGILCGTYPGFRWLISPFVEFARYLPPPAFSVLAVAVLGLYQAPKIFIVFLGTFFQLILVVAKTVSRVETSLVEAAQTLGTRGPGLLFRVVIPAALPYLYRDMRILLGWAWTWLVIAEVVGNINGLTWTIHQQARYRNFENVYAVILLIGMIGVATDFILASLERRFFPWEERAS